MASYKVQKIEWISPSVYLNLQKCFLKGVWVANQQPPLLPHRPEAYLGLLVHRMNEIAIRGQLTSIEAFDVTWDSELRSIEEIIRRSSIESQIVPLKEKIRDYEVLKELCKIRVGGICQKRGSHKIRKETDSRIISEEVPISIPGMSIKGILDIVIKRGNSIEIIDLKTGKIYEDINEKKIIKKDIISQMTFYAGLYYYFKGTWPIKLSVITRTGEQIKIDYSPQDSIQLISSAQCMKYTINSLIDNATITERNKLNILARPTPWICNYCEYRPSCIAYIDKRLSDLGTDWPADIFVIIESIEISKNNRVNITAFQMGQENIVRIANIPTEKIENWLERGDKLSFYNVKNHRGSQRRYDWQPNSIIHVWEKGEHIK